MMLREAFISADGQYRYWLSRRWEPAVRSHGRNDQAGGMWSMPLRYVVFVGLNPSTADGHSDDPTVRRCLSFAKTWGMGGLLMVNLFAHRTRHPRAMMMALAPIGPDNDHHIEAACYYADKVIACWGTGGKWMDRANQVMPLLGRRAHILACNRDGSPAHPLYLPRSSVPVPFGCGGIGRAI
jgi:hypothetical protein